MLRRSFRKERLKPHITSFKQHLSGFSFFIMVLILIGFLLYSTLTWMWDDQRLPLSKLVLQGDLEHVNAQDIQHAFAKLDHIGTFMSQDINSLQHSVQGLPWVSHVSIRKQWPDTVKIFITEYTAVAVWNGTALLDKHGVVFDGALDDDSEPPKLYGPKGSSQLVLDTWRSTQPIFQSLGLKVTSVVLNERRAWQMILDNGIRLELGKESLNERVKRFAALYRTLGDKAETVSYIDLRYDTGAAVGWFSEQNTE